MILNKHLLASKMGMNKGTFANKLNPDHATQFSDKELIQLKTVLIELRNDLGIVDIDFNDALKAIVT